MLIPVEMLCSISREGRMLPAKFRFQTEDEGEILIRVRRVAEYRDLGAEVIAVCEASYRNTVRQFVLNYNVRTHRWKLTGLR